ncbi:hypothetical protein PHIM7_282 [Sinorhizobium phage phiM7]|uniref:Transmembrane protein n=3 Tax=Emdodecavirus TaxID=1980937 RepID=S5M7G8_9CAUD|nr:hypothetical protein AB690_gp227 [Sinorhizobium phage phiM12]YP_009212526.1 hypothetical protein AVT40_gp247 [Sinorhizobium phage phiN3]YP_009601407.1 hypothetical protein FDH46_gp196 [Sinorhizobium phage phiM7]AKF13187.1 hypothetical protein PHIM19_282 [Sinorhizobium phage phiM19]AGR48001.1 hypothetical protein SmphiM12_369 [Sinorhizobium phage phiM12]AKF12827.1 hypothetical protein PHIM7_282 [Sinorhizobium phage phiM7]AKF13549.1 hypothetical protein PHIN3_286 [Sinorhizobium phage phiN3]
MNIRFPIFEKDPETPFEYIMGAALIILAIVSGMAIIAASIFFLGFWSIPIYGVIVLAIAFYKGYIKFEK